MTNLSELIVKYRNKSNISQRKLAKELGMSPTMLNRIELDKCPSINHLTLTRIAQVLKVDLMNDLVYPASLKVKTWRIK